MIRSTVSLLLTASNLLQFVVMLRRLWVPLLRILVQSSLIRWSFGARSPILTLFIQPLHESPDFESSFTISMTRLCRLSSLNAFERVALITPANQLIMV